MLKSDAVPVPARATDGSLGVLPSIVVVGCLLGGDWVGEDAAGQQSSDRPAVVGGGQQSCSLPRSAAVGRVIRDRPSSKRAKGRQSRSLGRRVRTGRLAAVRAAYTSFNSGSLPASRHLNSGLSSRYELAYTRWRITSGSTLP